MPGEITLAELVRNGTMSEEVAALLWAAVDERVSFLTVAAPRLAGKSTTAEAILALRPPGMPLHLVAGEQEVMDRLRHEKLGGYLVVAEFSEAPVPGYIWGEPVRRVFDTLKAGYSLQAALHATSVQDAILEVTAGCGVSDEDASAIGLVLYIELFGRSPADFWRRVTEVYEVDYVEGGVAVGRTLFRWTPETDRFDADEEPRNFAQDTDALLARAEVLGDLARSGRTSAADVQAALARYRASIQ
jgi:hypothetical protein